jgi:hypothetical protein
MPPLRHCLFTVALAVSAPLVAQPAIGFEASPWAADANGDGRINRDEMTAYMDRRFGLMDQDGDGLVPVPAMQRMLGHEQPARTPPTGGKRRGPGGPGAGAPPPGGHPAAGKAADAGPSPPPPGRAMPWPEDGNDDGQIDRAEFLAPALALFADQDRNGDDVLTADELPPPPERHPDD